MLSESDIEALINERKPFPTNFNNIQLKSKPGHKEYEIDIVGSVGSQFRVIFRQSIFNPLDFSVILTHPIARTNQIFRLRRYNGKSHEHTNHLERETFYNFHIHFATERYQQTAWREDAYARPTSRFASYQEAVECLLEDCGFERPAGWNNQSRLFML